MKTTVESKSLLGFNFTPCFFSSSQEVFWFLFLPSHFPNHLIEAENMSSFPPGTLSAFSCLQHQERYEYNIFYRETLKFCMNMNIYLKELFQQVLKIKLILPNCCFCCFKTIKSEIWHMKCWLCCLFDLQQCLKFRRALYEQLGQSIISS